MKTITIRFYEDDYDNEALSILNNYKAYGFSSKRNLIVNAIYLLKNNNSVDYLSDNQINLIADEVIKRIKKECSNVIELNSIQIDEELDSKVSREDLIDAIDFIDSL